MEVTGQQALVFAASCAERLLPLTELEPGQSSATSLSALERTWRIALSGARPADELLPTLETLVQRESRVTCEPSFTTDAAVCLIYALTAAGAMDPDAWARHAGRRTHEVVDSIVRWRDNVDIAQSGVNERLLNDPLIAGELEKQERDRNAIDRSLARDVIARVRAESTELGVRYAAEVTALRRVGCEPLTQRPLRTSLDA